MGRLSGEKEQKVVHLLRLCLTSTIMMMMTISSSIPTVSAEFHRLQHPITKGDRSSLRFLVVGDWGRKGDYNQSQVAFQMGRIGEKIDIDFVVSTGDNFYDDGLVGVDDPNFVESFSNIYTAKSLQKQWYNVLGNHDYRGDAVAQLSPVLREIDRRWFCLRNYVVKTDLADLIFLDTTPFVHDYFLNPDDHVYDWRDVVPVGNYTDNVLKDVESALNESKAKWKIVIGHHAIRSISHHGDTPELIQRLLPILQANNVDLYLNGHDHCLQRITDQDSPMQLVTSGAGSKAWRGDVKRANSQGLRFFYDGQGFMSVQLKPNRVKLVFYDISGKVLHHWSRTKHQLYSLM